MLITRIATAGFTPPSAQPCKAGHGYRATNAHHEEMGVSADGHVSAPTSGAAAAAPPAGAVPCPIKTDTRKSREYLFPISRDRCVWEGGIPIGGVLSFRLHEYTCIDCIRDERDWCLTVCFAEHPQLHVKEKTSANG
jgi:hypothetical protein